jgi:para-nitrobenzyl esterase
MNVFFSNSLSSSFPGFRINSLILTGLVLLFASLNALYGQDNCTPERYTDANYFRDNVIKSKDSVVFGHATDWEGNDVTLEMRIFYPDMSYDSIKKRPLIMLLHGGSYYLGNKREAYNLAFFLAQRGFVAVSINYRMGWDYSVYWKNKWDSTFYMAIYRSVQDSKAALRFLVHSASRYGIDTSRIFVGGLSAGAATSLYMAHCSQLTWDGKYPWIEKKLGSLDNSTNNLNDKYTIKGIFDMWGGIEDTAYISSASARQVPIVIFHGTADSIMPYTKFNKVGNSKMIPFYGGGLIAQRYKHLKAYYELNTNIKGGHGLGFSSKLIADKIGSFCKSIFEKNCKTSEFTIEH